MAISNLTISYDFIEVISVLMEVYWNFNLNMQLYLDTDSLIVLYSFFPLLKL